MADEKPQSGERVYEMLWDCQFCGAKKLLGKTHRFCPNCGGAQDATWRYFPSDDEKVAVQDHEFVGADRICPACSSLSAASAQFCGACGSPLEAAEAVKTVGGRARAQAEKFATEDVEARRQSEMMAAARGTTPQAQGARRGSRLALFIVLGVVGLVALAVLASIFWTQETTAVVVGHHWERSIQIEALQPVPSSSSCGAVPADAYGMDRRYEQVGSRSVQVGQDCRTVQEDRGDGTFRERQVCEPRYAQEPVYDYVCYYTVNRWVYTRTAQAQGTRAEALAWPDVGIQAANCFTLGCEREGSRAEQYTLVLRRSDNGETFECTVPAADWQDTPVERTFTLEVGRVMGDERCDTLTAR